jgi:hypothetical protein
MSLGQLEPKPTAWTPDVLTNLLSMEKVAGDEESKQQSKYQISSISKHLLKNVALMIRSFHVCRTLMLYFYLPVECSANFADYVYSLAESSKSLHYLWDYFEGSKQLKVQQV